MKILVLLIATFLLVSCSHVQVPMDKMASTSHEESLRKPSSENSDLAQFIQQGLIEIQESKQKLDSAEGRLLSALETLRSNRPKAYSATSSFMTESPAECTDTGIVQTANQARLAAKLSAIDKCKAKIVDCSKGESYTYKLVFRNSRGHSYRCDVTSTVFEIK